MRFSNVILIPVLSQPDARVYPPKIYLHVQAPQVIGHEENHMKKSPYHDRPPKLAGGHNGP